MAEKTTNNATGVTDQTSSSSMPTSSSGVRLHQSIQQGEQGAAAAAAVEDSSLLAKSRCEKFVEDGLNNNKTIQFLLNQLETLGCKPPPGFIKCTDCGDLQVVGAFHLLSESTAAAASTPITAEPQKRTSTAAGKGSCQKVFSSILEQLGQSSKADKDAYLEELSQDNKRLSSTTTTTKPEIFLCQQHVHSIDQAQRTIVHELVHAMDTCRTKMDPQKNCIHLACTEIRAENLSRECNFINELLRIGPHSLGKHGQECVERRATLSVQSHPRCRDRAPEYVQAAMNRCYNDIYPFERHPNEDPQFN